MEYFVARRVAHMVPHKDYAILSVADLSEEIRQFMIDLEGNELGRCLWELINLVRLEESRRPVDGGKTLRRNVLGLFKQAGIVRSIVPILIYLGEGSDRSTKAFLQHHLTEAFNKKSSPKLEAQALLAALSIVIWGQRVGLDSYRVRRVWRGAPSVIKRQSRWANRILRSDSTSTIEPEEVLERLARLDGGLASVTTAEIAFALNLQESDILKSMKLRRISR